MSRDSEAAEVESIEEHSEPKKLVITGGLIRRRHNGWKNKYGGVGLTPLQCEYHAPVNERLLGYIELNTNQIETKIKAKDSWET